MEEKNKSKNAGGVAVIFIIGILIIGLIVCIKYTQNLKTLLADFSVKIENLESELNKNIEKKKETKKISTDEFFDDVQEAHIYKNLELLSNDKSYSVDYTIKGKDKGKVIVKEYNKIISEEKLDKEVVDMYSIYANIFLLFEDGTIGKISLEENDYKLKMLEEYSNIVRIQEVEVHGDESAAIILVAIDSDGKVKDIGIVAD